MFPIELFWANSNPDKLICKHYLVVLCRRSESHPRRKLAQGPLHTIEQGISWKSLKRSPTVGKHLPNETVNLTVKRYRAFESFKSPNLWSPITRGSGVYGSSIPQHRGGYKNWSASLLIPLLPLGRILNTAAAALQSGPFAHQGFSMISMRNFHVVKKWGSVHTSKERSFGLVRHAFSMIGSTLVLKTSLSPPPEHYRSAAWRWGDHFAQFNGEISFKDLGFLEDHVSVSDLRYTLRYLHITRIRKLQHECVHDVILLWHFGGHQSEFLEYKFRICCYWNHELHKSFVWSWLVHSNLLTCQSFYNALAIHTSASLLSRLIRIQSTLYKCYTYKC